jgi:hypothetical protein
VLFKCQASGCVLTEGVKTFPGTLRVCQEEDRICVSDQQKQTNKQTFVFIEMINKAGNGRGKNKQTS